MSIDTMIAAVLRLDGDALRVENVRLTAEIGRLAARLDEADRAHREGLSAQDCADLAAVEELRLLRAGAAEVRAEKMRLHLLSCWVEEARPALAGVRPGGENHPSSTIGDLLLARQLAQEDYDSIYRVLNHDHGITLDIKHSRTRAICAFEKLRELLDAARKERDELRLRADGAYAEGMADGLNQRDEAAEKERDELLLAHAAELEESARTLAALQNEPVAVPTP